MFHVETKAGFAHSGAHRDQLPSPRPPVSGKRPHLRSACFDTRGMTRVVSTRGRSMSQANSPTSFFDDVNSIL